MCVLHPEWTDHRSAQRRSSRESRAQHDEYACSRAVHRTLLLHGFQGLFTAPSSLSESTNAKLQMIQVTCRALTSENCWHSKPLWRQQPLAALMLQRCSMSWIHGAPARCFSGQRCLQPSAPPRFCQCLWRRLPHGTVPAGGRRQCYPPGTLAATTDAATWSRRRQSQMPGSSAPVWPWLASVAGPSCMAR